ncbi:hypothetical protein HYC85_016952 [Camellia sinensis]|uniref:DEK-C domain-containing protein n=1 Tax=Camellia sinensis TaxID=4442 RepID=A0A7J7H4E9_CAMSI|nr:hypothetical protein HYC85_016952 [Camellia sinensis]
MDSDSKLVNRLWDVLQTSDLNTTTARSVRRTLESEFGVDLTHNNAVTVEEKEDEEAIHDEGSETLKLEGNKSESEEEEESDGHRSKKRRNTNLQALPDRPLLYSRGQTGTCGEEVPSKTVNDLIYNFFRIDTEQQQGGVSDEAEPFKGPDGRNLQLHFRSRLSLPLFTVGKVEGEQGAAIHIVLLDVNTGHVVTSGPESTIKLDVVVLEGDFNNEDDGGWTEEEFESHVVKEREGKRPLLTGDLQVTLKECVGTLGELTFTDNSSWIRSKKFRLGLKVASGFCEGIRVGEAKTEAFTVKDHRGELYKKHYPPALNDDVWRLEKIGKDGSFHKRLNKSGIFTVEDFVRLVVRDSQKLRTILSSGMSNKMWDALIEHAKTCAMSGKLYGYYADDTRNVGVVFNSIYKLSGLITGEQYLLSDSLSDSQKVRRTKLTFKGREILSPLVARVRLPTSLKSNVSQQPKQASQHRLKLIKINQHLEALVRIFYQILLNKEKLLYHN